MGILTRSPKAGSGGDGRPSSWQGFRAGESSVWHETYDRFHPVLWRWLLCRTGGLHQETEDLAAEVWLAAVESRKRYDPGRGSPEAWLVGIAMILLQRWRVRRRTRVQPLSLEAMDPAGELAPARELQRDIFAETALQMLSTSDRELLLQYRDASCRELAARYGVSESTMEGRLERARRRLAGNLRLLRRPDAERAGNPREGRSAGLRKAREDRHEP